LADSFPVLAASLLLLLLLMPLAKLLVVVSTHRRRALTAACGRTAWDVVRWNERSDSETGRTQSGQARLSRVDPTWC
jgi:cell division protein FtsL